MIVMGGIIGSGIFLNPSEVAREVNTAPVILGAWAAGGVVALLGAFVYAELAARRPLVGGQYAYIREAYHPAVAFVYGWALLLVIQSGGMAAVAITFAKYFKELTGIAAREWIVAVASSRTAYGNQLPGRARGQQLAKRAHGLKDRCDSRAGRLRVVCQRAGGRH